MPEMEEVCRRHKLIICDLKARTRDAFGRSFDRPNQTATSGGIDHRGVQLLTPWSVGTMVAL